jgi:hypothetical protein
MNKQTFLIILLPLLSACISKSENSITINTPQVEPQIIYRPTVVYTPPVVNEQVLQTAWSHLEEGDAWTKFTQNAIRNYGQGLLKSLPEDIQNYCPAYPNLNNRGRGDFWVQLISKLAYFESSYNTHETYRERFLDNDGKNVISRGLLQLSIESANGNYDCGLRNANELHDPKTNLECTVRIFNTLISKYGVIRKKANNQWFGVSRYWSPFRNERNDKMVEYTRSLALCR